MTDKVVHYVDNKKFLQEIIKYNKRKELALAAGLEIPRIPESIGRDILLISQGVAKRPNFYGYTYRDEMVADGYENCIRYFHNFNPEKSNNPFGYFSRIAYFAFVRYLQKEKKQSKIKSLMIMNSGVVGRLIAQQDNDFSDYTQNLQSELEDYINVDLMTKDEEEKMAKKLKTRKVKKGPLSEFIDGDSE